MPNQARGLLIRPIEATDDLSSIRVSDPDSVELKRYLVEDAWHAQSRGLAVTHGLFAASARELIGYMTMSVCSFQPGRKMRLHMARRPEAEPEFQFDYPGLRVARMLVDESHRGRRLGEFLLDAAVNLALDKFRPVTGCRFLFVDAKPNARAFYERYGFEVINTQHNLERAHPTMYLDLMAFVD